MYIQYVPENFNKKKWLSLLFFNTHKVCNAIQTGPAGGKNVNEKLCKFETPETTYLQIRKQRLMYFIWRKKTVHTFSLYKRNYRKKFIPQTKAVL